MILVKPRVFCLPKIICISTLHEIKVEKLILLHFIQETCYGCERLISMKRSFKKKLKKINCKLATNKASFE